MKRVIFFAILFFAVILQATILQDVKFFGVAPNVALVFLIFFAFWEKDYKNAFFSAIILGVLFDVLSGPFFGTFLLIFLFLAFLIYISAKVIISSDNNFAFLGIIFFGTIFYYILYYFCINSFHIFGLVDYNIALNAIFFETLALEVALNSLLAFALIPAKKYL